MGSGHHDSSTSTHTQESLLCPVKGELSVGTFFWFPAWFSSPETATGEGGRLAQSERGTPLTDAFPFRVVSTEPSQTYGGMAISTRQDAGYLESIQRFPLWVESEGELA